MRELTTLLGIAKAELAAKHREMENAMAAAQREAQAEIAALEMRQIESLEQLRRESFLSEQHSTESFHSELTQLRLEVSTHTNQA